MQENNRTVRGSHFLFLWFGAAVSIAEIMTGGLLAPLGFKQGLLAVLLGHLAGTTLLALGGYIGAREGIPALFSTRISFGVYGSYLFSALNILQLVGWTAVMIISAAHSANDVTRLLWGWDQLQVWSLFIGALVALWIALGREGGWKKLNMAAVVLLLGVTVMLSQVVFHDTGALTKEAVGGISFGGALELSVVMPLSWLPLIADYTRFARSRQGAVWGSWAGYFVGSCWMYIIGLGAALVSGSAAPSAMMLAAGLGFGALGSIVLATVTTTFMDAYSAGVSFANLVPAWNEKWMALVLTAIGTALALAVDMELYQDFLLAIGSVFAPLFAVLFSDYFWHGRRQVTAGLLVDWPALAVWGIGVWLYYQMLEVDFIAGATIPVMVITAILLKLVRQVGGQQKQAGI